MYLNFNPYVTVAHVTVRDRGYTAHISINTVSRQLHVFKYTATQCCYDMLDDAAAVTRFLDQPLGAVDQRP